MKYEIKPYIAVENVEYQTLVTEIMNFSIDELDRILKTMKGVLNNEVEASSFSQNVAVVEYNTQKATISYFDDIIGEERTIDIYTMLTEFATILRGAKTYGDYLA